MTTLVLALPNITLPFFLETDAFGISMGAILMQWGHPHAFFSKSFSPRLLHASIYVRELHAITFAVHKWRQYLLDHKFTILTDHCSLKDLMAQLIQTPAQQYHLTKLLRVWLWYSIQIWCFKCHCWCPLETWSCNERWMFHPVHSSLHFPQRIETCLAFQSNFQIIMDVTSAGFD